MSLTFEDLNDAIKTGYPSLFIGDKILDKLHEAKLIKVYKQKKRKETQRNMIQDVVYDVIKSFEWIRFENAPNPEVLIIHPETFNSLRGTKNESK